MRPLFTAAAGLAAVIAAGSGARAETVWNMPTPYPDASFHTQNIQRFAEDVAAATDGELEIVVHSAGSLFPHAEIHQAVATGQVPIGEELISLRTNEDPVFGVDSVPFLATSYDDARRLWQASRPVIEERLAADGLVLLFAVPWPPQGLYASRPVESIEDLSGVPFRAYNAATARVAELMGAVPTQVEVPEVPQAFATGIVEAMITSPTTGVSTQAWDFVDHYYDIQAWLPKNMVVVNRDAFEALPEDVQAAVRDAAAEAEARGWTMSAAESEEKTQTLADNGIQVGPPSATLEAELATIGVTMAAEWAEDAGPDGTAIIEAYEEGVR
jgi:TRAP-type C4-dicarboxylate transport system substrate-binding protein